VTGTELVRLPDVPVIVAVYVPGATALPAVKVTTLEVVVLGVANDALIPVGSPEMESDTVLVKPPAPTIETLPVSMELTGRVRLAGDADKLKFSAATSRSIVVLVERLPELPLTVIAYFPDATEGPAISVSVLVVLVLAGLKAALMPAGRPKAERLTVPLKPF
jgi:hypothetical protein